MPNDELLSDEGQSGTVEGASEGAEVKEQLSELNNRLKELATENARLSKSNEEFRKLLTSPDFLSGKSTMNAQSNSPTEGEDVDFDTLGGKQLAKVLQTRMERSLTALKADFEAKAKALREGMDALAVRTDVRHATLKYPALEKALGDPKIVSRLQELSREYPDKPVEKLWKLYQYEEREQREAEEGKQNEAKELQRRLISEKGVVPASVLAKEDMTPEQAVDWAWEHSLKETSRVDNKE